MCNFQLLFKLCYGKGINTTICFDTNFSTHLCFQLMLFLTFCPIKLKLPMIAVFKQIFVCFLILRFNTFLWIQKTVLTIVNKHLLLQQAPINPSTATRNTNTPTMMKPIPRFLTTSPRAIPVTLTWSRTGLISSLTKSMLVCRTIPGMNSPRPINWNQ